jgi:hypothetical protein
MIYRQLTDDGDMTIGNKNAYIEGVEAVRQAVVTRLRQLIYEWWEQLEDGVPYWQKIIARRDIAEAVRIIRARIEQTTDVIAILVFEHYWNNETRSLTIRAGIQSVYGEFVIEEAFT